MKIKYNSIYYPDGEWVDENGNKVEMIKKSFHAKYNGRNIFVIINEVSVNDGHMNMGPSTVPTFYDSETLCELKSVGYIETK
ncbi:hypothetical protein [Providencia sp. PROV092]|uniref:hypothetical protein n=1 Tax=Providencia sp. PROV092 TaxID=2949808 RepID=UPI00234916C4|nr:hypothetical protein [Providencia sp. PROV092]